MMYDARMLDCLNHEVDHPTCNGSEVSPKGRSGDMDTALYKNASNVQEFSTSWLLTGGVSGFILRDDLLDPDIIGNKWRKLIPHLAVYASGKFSALATMGGAYSNMILSASYLTPRFNVPTIGIIRGDELNTESNAILRQCARNGMKLYFVNRVTYAAIRENGYVAPSFLPANTYFVAEGGFSRLSFQGAATIMESVAEKFDHIICAVGTGTTIAGICETLKKRGLEHATVVHGICVVKAKASITQNLVSLLGEMPSNLRLVESYGSKRFGRPDQDVTEAMKRFMNETAIETDYNYTGRVILAAETLIATGEVRRHQRVLLVHSGGCETAGLHLIM
jgi:1-aminocyclopropane-1-carboxylate deaminase